MTAPDQLQDVKLTLAKREPSTHDLHVVCETIRYFQTGEGYLETIGALCAAVGR